MIPVKFPLDPRIGHGLKLTEETITNLYYEYNLYLKNVNLLYEGLITSYPMQQTIKIIVRNGYKTSSVDSINNTFVIKIEFYSKNSCIEQVHELIKLGDRCGWTISEVRYNLERKNVEEFLLNYTSKTNVLYLDFEAKYDIEIKDIPSHLYHVTPKENFNKIMKYGLIPKTENKMSSHPDRIYFLSEYTDDSIQQLINRLYTTSINKKSGEYYLLEIVNPKGQIPGLRLYKDPRYLNKGMYTLQSIDPKVINKLKEYKINIYE